MVKLDAEGFMAMMSRIDDEREGNPYEELKPDYEYLHLDARCGCTCHH